MTQTQTTAERIAAILRVELERGYTADIGYNGIMGIPAASIRIAAEVLRVPERDEIDALTVERDEARESLGYVQAETDAMYRRVVMLEAEVERFRPAAEAWKAREAQRIAFETFDRDPTPGNHDALTDANMAMLGTGLRARAAKEAKP